MIKCIMTTKDRIELLEMTVSSLLKSSKIPNIEVFDDMSDDVASVEKIIAKIPGAKFFKATEKIGCNMKTPNVLRDIFASTDCEAIFILDSDTAFHKDWWSRVLEMYGILKSEPDFGAFALINCSNGEGAECDHEGMLAKGEFGAFGSMITRAYFNKYVIPQFEHEGLPWDAAACRMATKDGKKNYTSVPSYLQHTGTSIGSHVGGTNVAFATDYIGELEEPKINSGSTKSVMIGCFGGYGEVAKACLFANQLIGLGYTVSFNTIIFYERLVRFFLGNIPVVIGGMQCPENELEFCDSIKMSVENKGFSYYLNLQIASPEHANSFSKFIGSTVEYLSDYLEKELKEEIHRDLKKFSFAGKSSRNVSTLICTEYQFPVETISHEDTMSIVNKITGIVGVLSTRSGNSSRELRRLLIQARNVSDLVKEISSCNSYIGTAGDYTWIAIAFGISNISVMAGDSFISAREFGNLVDGFIKVSSIKKEPAVIPVKRKVEIIRDESVSDILKNPKKQIEKQTHIPKKLFCYWDGSRMSYLRYMTIASFQKFNPKWTILLCVPFKKSKPVNWKTGEQAIEYTGPDWFDKAKESADGVMEIKMSDIGFSDDLPEVCKSDIIRNYLISTYGGIYSDMDVLYCRSIPDYLLMKDFISFDGTDHRIGFIGSGEGGQYYSDMFKLQRKVVYSGRYQGFGSEISNSISIDEYMDRYQIFNIPLNLVYPFNDHCSPFAYKCDLPEDSIGIHWYGGNHLTREWEEQVSEASAPYYDNVVCKTLKKVLEKR